MYLGLDLGTSGLKGLLVSNQQELIGSADASYAVENSATGWSEQNPNDWIKAFESVMNSLSDRFQSQMSALRAVSYTHLTLPTILRV